jgi:hypothetical protein
MKGKRHFNWNSKASFGLSTFDALQMRELQVINKNIFKTISSLDQSCLKNIQYQKKKKNN